MTRDTDRKTLSHFEVTLALVRAQMAVARTTQSEFHDATRLQVEGFDVIVTRSDDEEISDYTESDDG